MDWLFWIGGPIIAVAGLGAALWALLGDRVRGGRRLRRCPRCWYDMNGVPGLTCPECGHEAAGERRLHRSRKRWRLAAAGALVVLLGSGAYKTPALRAEGWRALVPTTALIVMLPRYDDPPRWYDDLLFKRTGMATIPSWQRRLLFSRCGVVICADRPLAAKLNALQAIESIAWRVRYPGRRTGEAHAAIPVLLRALGDDDARVRAFAAQVLPLASDDTEGVIAAITPLLASDPSPNVRRAATSALYGLGAKAAPAARAAVACLEFKATEPDGPAAWILHRDILLLLGSIGPDAAEVTVPALIAALERPNEDLRSAAATALGKLGPAAAAAAPALLPLLEDIDLDVRRQAVKSLPDLEVGDEAVLRALLVNVGDLDWFTSTGATIAISRLWPDDAAVTAKLRARLQTVGTRAIGLVRALGHADRDIRPYADFLVPGLTNTKPGDWEVRFDAARLLCRCGYTGEDAREPALALRSDEITRVRVWGELLSAQLDGDRSQAVGALIMLIQRSVPADSNTRGDAAEALALIGPGAEAALPHLEAMLEESAWAPREHAKRAIHAITGEPLTGRLKLDGPAGDD